jgi:phospholipid/cholesterol/gamma-HCH transport system substrate-binding protein
MSAAKRDEKHLEIKVGAMIIVALALLVTFVLILGDFTFRTQVQVEVYYQNPGGLSPGAAVKVAGRRAGSITEMTFLGQTGPVHPVTQRKALVRARVEIDEEVKESLRADARFYITTKGVLGDPFLEIDPGVDPVPLDTTKPVFGIDPPRLDLFLADAAELVDGLNRLLDRNAENLDQLLGGSARIIGAVDEMMAEDGGTGTERFDRIADNVEGLVTETRELVVGAREKYVDDPGVARTLDNLEQLSAKLNRELPPLMRDVRQALEIVERMGDTIGPEEQQSIKSALGQLDDIARRANSTLAKVDRMVDKMNRGEGTVGQLLQDEEVYDDLKELIRDLKRHPWKLIWED